MSNGVGDGPLAAAGAQPEGAGVGGGEGNAPQIHVLPSFYQAVMGYLVLLLPQLAVFYLFHPLLSANLCRILARR